MRKSDTEVTEEQVHQYIHDHPKCAVIEMAAALKTNRTTIDNRCRPLLKKGFIDRRSPPENNKNQYWSLKAPIDAASFEPEQLGTSPKLLMSKLWKPNHLELNA
jgi:predicted transcriptional regulator